MRDKEYERSIRVALHESNDALRITIPKKIKFCATIVHVYFRDPRTIVVSPNKTKQTQYTAGVARKAQTAGCVEFVIGHVGHVGIGKPFGITPVESYQWEEGDLVITFPVPEKRRVAKICNTGKKPQKIIDAPSGTVAIDVFDNQLEFIVPQTVLFELIIDWQDRGFKVSG